MKKMLLIGLMVGLTSVSYADFTETDYSTMTNSIQRLNAAAEIRAEFQNFFADWEKRKARILSYSTKLGSADAVIPQAYITEATAIFNAVTNGVDSLETTYKVFLTGDDGQE